MFRRRYVDGQPARPLLAGYDTGEDNWSRLLVDDQPHVEARRVVLHPRLNHQAHVTYRRLLGGSRLGNAAIIRQLIQWAFHAMAADRCDVRIKPRRLQFLVP